MRSTREIKAIDAAHADARALLQRYVAELHTRLGGFDATRAGSAEPDEMRPPHGAFLVLYEEGVPVACGGLRTEAPGVGEIKRMYVADESRGRGHARALLTALEDAARALGHVEMVLDTAAPLEEAHRLYGSAGYESIAPYNDNPYAARWFRKRL